MRKTVTIVLTVLSGLIILDSFDAGQAIMMFFLAGVIPGTHISLSAQVMLEAFTLALGFVLARLTSRFFISLFDKIPARHHA